MSTSTESGPVMNDLEDRVRTLEQIPNQPRQHGDGSAAIDDRLRQHLDTQMTETALASLTPHCEHIRSRWASL